MHLYQIILPALLAVAFVRGCMKAPRKMIGGVIGGLLGVLIPFLCSELYVWRGGDPTAAGVFSFFCIFTLPAGIFLGVIVASWTSKGRGTSDDNEV
jgi:hypothetical protein